jgi:hypothetical protein
MRRAAHDRQRLDCTAHGLRQRPEASHRTRTTSSFIVYFVENIGSTAYRPTGTRRPASTGRSCVHPPLGHMRLIRSFLAACRPGADPDPKSDALRSQVNGARLSQADSNYTGVTASLSGRPDKAETTHPISYERHWRLIRTPEACTESHRDAQVTCSGRKDRRRSSASRARCCPSPSCSYVRCSAARLEDPSRTRAIGRASTCCLGERCTRGRGRSAWPCEREGHGTWLARRLCRLLTGLA